MRVWQFMEVTNVIVVQVRQNNIGDCIRVNIEVPQAFDRTAQERAFPASSGFRSEASVNQKNALRPDNDPGKVIHGHGSVMRVAADKMVRSSRVAYLIAKILYSGRFLVMSLLLNDVAPVYACYELMKNTSCFKHSLP